MLEMRQTLRHTAIVLLVIVAALTTGCASRRFVGSTVPPYVDGQAFVSAYCMTVNFVEPCEFAFHLVRDKAAHVLLLARFSSRGAAGTARYVVIDSFAPIQVTPGDSLLMGSCGLDRIPGAAIFALVDKGDGKQAKGRAKFALRANLVSGLLERIDATALDCINEGGDRYYTTLEPA